MMNTIAALRARVAELEASIEILTGGLLEATEKLARTSALRARVAQLEAALKKFKTDMCEGWCDETDHIFSDCQGCEARAALKDAPQ